MMGLLPSQVTALVEKVSSYFIAHADLELPPLRASVSQVLGLQLCATMPVLQAVHLTNWGGDTFGDRVLCDPGYL